MAWSWGKKSGRDDRNWSVEQYPSKKRKLDERSRDVLDESHEQKEDDWDDAGEYTQDELDALDNAIIQSQVPAPAQTAEPSTDAAFVIPVNTVHSRVNRSASSSSDSSVLPRSLSSRSTVETSTSLSSHSSTNGKHDSSTKMVQTQQAKLDEERTHAQQEKYLHEGEVKSLRERLHQQKDEMAELQALRDESYEKQRKLQAEKILKLQSQLDSLTSQAQFKERDYQSLQEKFSILQQKTKRLEQQAVSSIGQSDFHLPQSPKPVSPRKIPVRPSPPSKQKEMKEAASSNKSTFPTTHAFLEQTVSAPNASSAQCAASSVSCQTSGTNYATKPPQSRRLQLSVGTTNAFGELAGHQIVRHLIQAGASEGTCESKDELEKAQYDPGLMDLIHSMSTTVKIAGLTYSRGKDSTVLTPVRPQKRPSRSPGVDLITDKTVQVVTRENLQLAIKGLILLLDDMKGSKDMSDQDSELSRFSESTKSFSTYLQADAASDSSAAVNCGREAGTSADKSCHEDIVRTPPDGPGSGVDFLKKGHEFYRKSGAVMLLPLLTNYIQHYVDIIHSSFGRVSGLFSPGKASSISPQSRDSFHSFAENTSSCDSSFDSLSTHLGQLLQEGKIYASSIEGYAITALRCLAVLIRLCQEVGQKIVADYTGMTVSIASNVTTSTASSSSNLGTETDQQSKKTSSSLEADDELSSSSEIRIIRGASNQSQPCLSSELVGSRVGLTLLHLIMRLAGQDLEDSQSNPVAVKLSLCVLTYLCRSCTEEELPKLETIITRGILTSCFRQTKHIPVLICVQRLLFSLTKSEKLLARICTKSENCPFYLMHRACLVKADGLFDLYKEYITGLSSLMSKKISGLYFLLCNTCPCSDELIPAVITVLYNLFSMYKSNETKNKVTVLTTLAQGVVLINSLARTDTKFTQHHMVVKQQYVRMLSGLLPIMRSDPHVWEYHLSALEELCDFEPDTSDTSQEGEGEERMDQA